MTKRKKRLLTVLISILCTLMILFSLFWFVPYRRHWNFRKTPVETEDLFPMPDEIVLIRDGWAKKLDEEHIPAVYEALVWLEDVAFGTSGPLMPYSAIETAKYRLTCDCIELRYRQRYKYTGELSAFYGEEYDALLLTGNSAFAWVIPYKGCTYRAVGNSYAYLIYADSWSGQDLNDEAKTVSDYIKSFYDT